MGQRAVRCSGLAALALLLLAAPRPTAALAALTAAVDTAAHTAAHTAGQGGDPTGPVVAAAALAAYLLVGWLLVVSALTLGEQLPGTLGRAAGALSRRVAPAAVRRGVALTLGLTLSAGALGSTAASASPRTPGAADARAARATASLDWPAGPPVVAPALDWAPEKPAAPGPSVVVAPGDSLWTIAAAHLPAGAGNARIARAWPSWWAANRDVLGANPDLIQPGTPLHAPPS